METNLICFVAGFAVGLMIGIVAVIYITMHRGGL